ncbi:cobaltochelatase subunit CobN [Emcibacter nanhaiensis]|uniref:Cobaltochelatase subunit CobN n=1 Tax=Emcibacter nanhaiensis TaxID=1505037 RepID=A0A501PJF8_9PROT|nr:cobaltochelatase subunit CobN [Emcibacter nanhaiensis]TPD60643.1 cobaltochelatase subunit CobN [Emcibacter nanhaiensis]
MRVLLFSLLGLLVWGVFAPDTAFAGNSKPVHVTVITNNFVLPSKITRLRAWGQDAGVQVSGKYIETAEGKPQDWLSADLVILDTPRGGDRARVMEHMKEALEGTTTPWIVVGGGRPLSGNLDRVVAGRLSAYYDAGGEENFVNMMRYISAWKGGADMASIPAAVPLPATGFYHPDAPVPFATLQAYLAWGERRWEEDAPVMAVAISSSYLSNAQTKVLEAVVDKVEAAGGIPLLFWFNWRQPDGITSMIAGASPDMLVNMTHMLSGDARKKEFLDLDVPVVMGLTHRAGTPADWREDPQGVEMRTVASLMATPEGWGMSDPLVLGAVEDGDPVPIEEQLDLLVGRFMKIARLRHSDPQERKVALLFWNSPGGEKNLSASNLNVPQSIENIMFDMKKAEYELDILTENEIIEKAQAMLGGYYRPETLDELLMKGWAVSLPVSRYREWLDGLPEKISREMTDYWGKPEDHWSVRKINGAQQFVIPMVQTGKFLFTPQPPRADKVGESTHDLKQPPGHFYMAFYLYLREIFGSDAIIHLGTHGTQEWTPGKDRGLWAHDYPNLAVGNVPVLYPYIQDNIGEAIQAKRRGRAVTVSHQTPAFAPSGFYDELLDMHDLIHQYLQLEEGAVQQETAERLIGLVKESSLDKELGWSEEKIREDFEGFIPILHDHLHQLARTAVPMGLHSFGEPAIPEQRITTVLQQSGDDYYRALGLDLKEMFGDSFDELYQNEAYLFLKKYVDGVADFAGIADPNLRQMIEQALANERHLAEDGEMEALLSGLNGRFVRPGVGGDPVRNPQSTSGTNLYAFEPDKVPAKAAYEAAGEAFEELVKNYRAEHDGAWPDKLAFSLWSSETIRTLGIMEGQVMHALGVRPVWDAGGRVVDLEIIPAEELGRPRVDAVLQVTSVYRDQFDGIMRLIAGAIEEISVLEEKDNAVAVNSNRIIAQLREAGASEADARRYAAIRIFSNPPGDYGSGVTQVAMDPTSWDDDSILAETFFNSQSHAYGTKDWGTPVRGMALFEKQLSGVDAAILSRSTNLHGLLSTDHPFEYLGGLSAASRAVNGESPDLIVSDYRGKKPKMAKASAFLSNELRVRYQNPQWIGAMKEEGYAGTVNMLKVVNNLFGWQVMDERMVRDDQWQAMHETYVMDNRDMGLNEWFEEHNPTAQAQMIERMAEAIRKGYWEASEQTRRELAERWQDLVANHRADRGADKTAAFLEEMAVGFGLGAPTTASDTAPDQPAAQQPAEPVEKIRGRIMEQVQPAEPDPLAWLFNLVIWLGLLSIIGVGGIHTTRRHKQYQV